MSRWLGLRLELTGTLIILFVSLFVVIKKEQINAGTAGLSLSYAISVIKASVLYHF
jgi:ATP-binding cassette subfamily C (CFTR/MRP) protein 1